MTTFTWLNQGLSYTPPGKREIMPTGRLLGYAREHWMPYACHMLFVSMVATVSGPYYAYPAAVVATAALLLYFGWQGRYPELSLKGTTPLDWLLAVGVGVVGIALWIAPYHFLFSLMFARIPLLGNENIYLSLTYGFSFPPDSFKTVLGGLVQVPTCLPKPTYDPTTLAGTWKTVFLACRMVGACITVPFFEELFIRSCVVRFIEDEQYKRVPIGWWTRRGFLWALGVYVVAHPWWLVAILWGGLTFWLFYYRKNLMLNVIAHAVSNLVLALYVLHTGNYYLW